ncbi:VOC family protein [Streptomyces niveus]|uniref:VOC family protein n=1 Tax=Streptomyces niveus TaxID=193462 RepID=UPI0034270CFC
MQDRRDPLVAVGRGGDAAADRRARAPVDVRRLGGELRRTRHRLQHRAHLGGGGTCRRVLAQELHHDRTEGTRTAGRHLRLGGEHGLERRGDVRAAVRGHALDRRVHLDLYARDAAEQAAEVARLKSLGAERVDWDRYPDNADFVVLADTEGNRFCVIDTTHG